jgi:hypothetical protein
MNWQRKKHFKTDLLVVVSDLKDTRKSILGWGRLAFNGSSTFIYGIDSVAIVAIGSLPPFSSPFSLSSFPFSLSFVASSSFRVGGAAFDNCSGGTGLNAGHRCLMPHPPPPPFINPARAAAKISVSSADRFGPHTPGYLSWHILSHCASSHWPFPAPLGHSSMALQASQRSSPLGHCSGTVDSTFTQNIIRRRQKNIYNVLSMFLFKSTEQNIFYSFIIDLRCVKSTVLTSSRLIYLPALP